MFPYPKGTHVQVGAYLFSVSGKGQNSEGGGGGSFLTIRSDWNTLLSF